MGSLRVYRLYGIVMTLCKDILAKLNEAIRYILIAIFLVFI